MKHKHKQKQSAVSYVQELPKIEILGLSRIRSHVK